MENLMNVRIYLFFNQHKIIINILFMYEDSSENENLVHLLTHDYILQAYY